MIFKKYLMKCIYLLLFFATPLITGSELTGEVVFIHPDNPNELWITDLTETDNKHLIYKQTHPIRDFSVQKNGNYIATITEYSAPNKPVDIYLIDRNKTNQVERMMTHQRFDKILEIYLSQHPELFFTNYLPIRTEKNKRDRFGPVTSGIYLIKNKEIVDPSLPPPPFVPLQLEDIIPPKDDLSPRVTHIKSVEAQHVALSPNKKYLAYDTPVGIYILKFATGQVLQVSVGGNMPIFSPDGTKLVVVHKGLGNSIFSYGLEIYSVPNLHLINTIESITKHLQLLDIKWSPDGKYIVYTTYGGTVLEQNTTYYHHAIPYNGGEQIRILDIFENGVPKFDWTHVENTYSVKPKNLLTTLWGKLKE